MRRSIVLRSISILVLLATGCAQGASDSTGESTADEQDEQVDLSAAGDADGEADVEAEAAADAGDVDGGETDTSEDASADADPETDQDLDGDGDEGTATSTLPSFDFAEVDTAIGAFVERRDLNGAGFVVVHRDHGIVHHEHWGVFDEDRISLFASSSKMVTAGVLLHLDDQGLLDIDAPVAEVAEWGAGNPEITTAQLLSNSSGLVGLFPDPIFGPYLCQWISAGTLQDCAASIMTTTGDDDLVAAPDTEFRYGGAQWQVAGAVAEVVSGRSWQELIEEIYVEPCGLEVLGYNSHFDQIETDGFRHPPGFRSDPGQMVPSANPSMEAGLYSNTTDYAQLLLMHLRDGMCGANRVLSTDALARMHGDRIGEVYDGDAYSPDQGYGMGWWVARDTGYIQDGGAYGSVPWLDLADGYGALLLTESDNGTANELVAEIIDAVDAAVADAVG